MTALVRYVLASVVHSQRYLPPYLVFLAVMGILTSNDAGSLLPIYAVAAGVELMCATWLTIVVANADDPGQRAITVVNAGGSGRVLVATVLVTAAGCVVMTLFGLFFPLTSGRHRLTVPVVAIGTAAMLTAACTGMAIGLLCARPVIRRTGIMVLTAIGAMLVFLLVPGVPPVNPVFHLLAGDQPPAHPVGPMLLFGAIAVLLLAGSTALARFFIVRRD
ncbi:MAG TPA: hypothetical protein VH333_15230 [Pseudonocardiaceae bacterium]|jgi:hypothetical protein|nr:hypothetical protein [Pseudonocardiaceae bacterium]